MMITILHLLKKKKVLHVIKNWVVHRIINKSRDTQSKIIENFFFYKNSNQWKLMRMKQPDDPKSERERERKNIGSLFSIQF